MTKTTRMTGLGIFVLALIACGGLGTPGTAFTVAPQSATTTANGTVKILVIVANADVQHYDYSVEGGSANGVVTPVFNDPARATYTAPSTPGIYVVHAGFTQVGGEVHSSDITITVQ